jgi:polyhydroxyalkanoate synthase subunit PhaC
MSDYAALLEQWYKLWQTGFATMWAGYNHWLRWATVPEIGRREVGQTPADEIWRKGRVRLYRYRPVNDNLYSRPILCVPSLINRNYILDLMRGRSLVAYLVGRGLNVYMLDWGQPTAEDSHLTLDEHLTGYLRQAVAAVRAQNEDEPVNLLGYCMGGMFAAIYASQYQEEVAGLVNLAGPINYHDGGIFSLLTRADWFDADKLVASYGNIPADLLSWTFQMLRPTSHLLRALYLAEHLDDPNYVRSYAAMQTWIFDQVDFPGEAFRRYIKALYQGNQLVRGEFTLDGRPVNLHDITCPVLTIASYDDETAPCGSVAILHDLVASQGNQLLLLHGPHVGMVAGSKAPQKLWPKLADWLVAHSEP